MPTVYVTNKWEKPISFSFEYQNYLFPIGETVEVPADAARYIFGYGEEDKVPNMVRLAIINTTNDIPEGYKIMEKFVVTEQAPLKALSLSPQVERVPLPPNKVGGKFISRAA